MEQKRQRVVVRMAPRPDIAPLSILLLRSRMVLHVAQVLKALGLVAVPLDKEVLVVQLQRESKELEQRQKQAVVDLEREGLDLLPVVEDQLRMRPFVLRGEFGNVVPLIVVATGQFAGRLCLVAPEVAFRGVTLELQFLLEREVEDGLAEGVLAPDFGIGEAVAGDVEEAWGVLWIRLLEGV